MGYGPRPGAPKPAGAPPSPPVTRGAQVPGLPCLQVRRSPSPAWPLAPFAAALLQSGWRVLVGARFGRFAACLTLPLRPYGVSAKLAGRWAGSSLSPSHHPGANPHQGGGGGCYLMDTCRVAIPVSAGGPPTPTSP